MEENTELIKESCELWLKLSELANFDDTAYDDELKNSIIQTLKLGTGGIADELKKHNISTTGLLIAILDALEPFSQMMVDLLNLYNAAGANSNAHNIQLEFEFDGKPHRYSLNEFKEQKDYFQERSVKRTRLINPRNLIARMDEIENGIIRYNNDLPEQVYYGQIQAWLAINWKGILPEYLPPFPTTNCDQIDKKLAQLIKLVEEAIQCDRKEYSPLEEIEEQIMAAANENKPKNQEVETDNWIKDFVISYYNFVCFLIFKISNNNSISDVVESVDRILADPKVFSIVTEIEQVKAVREILNMPFWKHRYEMYSVWVFTCIADAFSDLGIRYNVTDGVLQFKFSGTKLATVDLPDMQFEICAEIQHPAKEPIGEGRINNIQPDYTILSKTKDKSDACLLIECKQYKKSNKKNFASAVNDYARAKPNAMVFLSNYGRISRNFSKWFALEIRRRSKDYSFMKPESESRNDFINDVRNYIETVWADNQLTEADRLYLWEERPTQFKIELSWQRYPVDLDLEVAVKDASNEKDIIINLYRSGDKNKYPYVQYEKDVQEGPGKETINVTKIISGCYNIYVQHYYHRENDEEFIEDQIEVKIYADNQCYMVCKSGNWMKGKKWYVGAFNAIGFVKKDIWVDNYVASTYE